MAVDVLPNLVVPLVVYGTLLVPQAIVFEATLSFLGLGVAPPTATWGDDARRRVSAVPGAPGGWWWCRPVAVLALTLALNLLGDALHDAFGVPRTDTAAEASGVTVRFLLRRIVSGVLTMLFICVVMFVLFYVAPNDPARTIAGPQATFDVVDQIRARLGLDQPMPTRFGHFIGDVLHGDLGFSYYNQRPVLDTILDRLPVTASLAIGVGGAVARGRDPDRCHVGAPPGQPARPVRHGVRAGRAQPSRPSSSA